MKQRFRVWASIPMSTVVEADSAESAIEEALKTGGDGWENCYDYPEKQDVYDVQPEEDET